MRASGGGLDSCVSVRVDLCCVVSSTHTLIHSPPVPPPPSPLPGPAVMDTLPITVVQEFSSGGAVEPPRLDKEMDAIKLFVGQVPKTFEEKDLRPFLEQYGPIHELSILRDKITKAHKGRRSGRGS